MVFLHAHLQVAYYNCVKFHKNSISSLVGVVLTRYMPTPFRESISWIISPFKFWTATIFLHAHLQVVYYNCVKFHKTPISHLGGVALTRYMDGRTDGRTGWFLYTPQTLFAGGIIIYLSVISWRSVLLVEETGVPGEKHRPATSHWQTLSHNVVSSTPCLSGNQTYNVSGDRHLLHR
jgi:hypothetical protein